MKEKPTIPNINLDAIRPLAIATLIYLKGTKKLPCLHRPEILEREAFTLDDESEWIQAADVIDEVTRRLDIYFINGISHLHKINDLNNADIIPLLNQNTPEIKMFKYINTLGRLISESLPSTVKRRRSLQGLPIKLRKQFEGMIFSDQLNDLISIFQIPDNPSEQFELVTKLSQDLVLISNESSNH